MRVGILSYLMHSGAGYRAAGVSIYTRSLLQALGESSGTHRYIAFRGLDSAPVPGVDSAISLLPTHHALLRIGWEQVAVPIEARRRHIDLLHGTVNVVPIASMVPSVVTVHDLAFLRHPERFPASKVAYLRAAVAASVRRARRVIAVSATTARDLQELLGVSAERITVIYPGVDSSFRPRPPAEVEAFRREVFGGRPYVLFVGTLEPRKNIDVLIRAFAAAKRDLGFPHVLALVGGRGWMFESIFTLIADLGIERDVRSVDYVAQELLPLWYNGADLFVYPSVYEGFGLPVLEAMASGAPVITSSVGSMAEIAGDASLAVEPGSQELLQMAIGGLIQDPSRRDQLRAAGLARAADFGWRRAAAATVGVYESIMARPR